MILALPATSRGTCCSPNVTYQSSDTDRRQSTIFKASSITEMVEQHHVLVTLRNLLQEQEESAPGLSGAAVTSTATDLARAEAAFCASHGTSGYH